MYSLIFGYFEGTNSLAFMFYVVFMRIWYIAHNFHHVGLISFPRLIFSILAGFTNI